VKRVLPVLGLVIGILCTSGVAFADGTWLPDNFSTLGKEIDHLWQMIFWMVTIVFFLTEGALIYFVVRFRERPGQKAAYIRESNALEVVWSVIPALVLVFLALYQWNTWAEAKLRPPESADTVKVQILAQQFEWNVRYAGPDGAFATDDDLTMKNQLYIPEGKPILIQIRALDVIHSFFLPNFRVKQDAVPGTTVQVWFDANKTGKYEIACSEICGLGHYRMRALLHVYTNDEFESWLQEKYDAGATPADWGWDWEEGV